MLMNKHSSFYHLILYSSNHLIKIQQIRLNTFRVGLGLFLIMKDLTILSVWLAGLTMFLEFLFSPFRNDAGWGRMIFSGGHCGESATSISLK